MARKPRKIEIAQLTDVSIDDIIVHNIVTEIVIFVTRIISFTWEISKIIPVIKSYSGFAKNL